jgi:hypothetical protein
MGGKNLVTETLRRSPEKVDAQDVEFFYKSLAEAANSYLRCPTCVKDSFKELVAETFYETEFQAGCFVLRRNNYEDSALRCFSEERVKSLFVPLLYRQQEEFCFFRPRAIAITSLSIVKVIQDCNYVGDHSPS